MSAGDDAGREAGTPLVPHLPPPPQPIDETVTGHCGGEPIQTPFIPRRSGEAHGRHKRVWVPGVVGGDGRDATRATPGHWPDGVGRLGLHREASPRGRRIGRPMDQRDLVKERVGCREFFGGRTLGASLGGVAPLLQGGYRWCRRSAVRPLGSLGGPSPAAALRRRSGGATDGGSGPGGRLGAGSRRGRAELAGGWGDALPPASAHARHRPRDRSRQGRGRAGLCASASGPTAVRVRPAVAHPALVLARCGP
jgi:hypothetical protein